MPSVRLFVYGSLKRNGRHHEELRGARFLAEARTLPGFELTTLRLGADDYLALVPAPGSTLSVPGELFEVPAELLRALDAFEGEAYARAEVPLCGSGRDPHADGADRALAYFKKSR